MKKSALKLASTPAKPVRKVYAPKAVPANYRALYKLLVKHLAINDRFEETDKILLIDYCSTQQMIDDAHARIDQDGFIIEGPSGIRPHPGIAIVNSCTASLIKIATALTITPSARKKLAEESKPEASVSKANPWK